MGVRISWLMFAKNWLLAWLAASAASLAFLSSSSCLLMSLKSCHTDTTLVSPFTCISCRPEKHRAEQGGTRVMARGAAGVNAFCRLLGFPQRLLVPRDAPKVMPHQHHLHVHQLQSRGGWMDGTGVMTRDSARGRECHPRCSASTPQSRIRPASCALSCAPSSPSRSPRPAASQA
ncbi:hypothetical protein CLOM_g9220 [Closterium sp. NIES-68]|nr:hypothetical protein CLOM_g9220 [Closterium sp. NIES-68]GJP61416.1 hypothetical protein CLOP_g18583 [Closterium sp. NIES-67]